MSYIVNNKWSRADMVGITLNDPDDFLKIKETLMRIGVASHRESVLYQSCHILHKQGNYYIVHFKEMFLIDGKPGDISLTDILRRNAIVKLVAGWGLCEVIDPSKVEQCEDTHNIKIIKFSEKKDWVLRSKYTIGK